MAFKRRRSTDWFNTDRFFDIAEKLLLEKDGKQEEPAILRAEDALVKARVAKITSIAGSVREAISRGDYSVKFDELIDWDICKVFEQKGYQVLRHPKEKSTVILWGVNDDN